MNKQLVSCLKHRGTRLFGTSSNFCKKGGGASAAGLGTAKVLVNYHIQILADQARSVLYLLIFLNYFLIC